MALIGAARFVRAQRVAGDLVNLYIPLADSMTLEAETALPLLAGTDCTPDHAFTHQWLRYAQYGSLFAVRWNGLAYQTLQTQGAQQSTSLDRGCLDYTWLADVEQRAGAAVIHYWTALLHNRREHIPFEIDHLLDSLTRHREDAWMAHLRDIAFFVHHHPDAQKRLYSVQEAKEITTAMSSSTTSPLSTILGREKGTLRFGHALRLLGKFNPAPLRDIIDALDAVRSCDTLMRVLAQAAKECTIAAAKSEFILIPDDEDLAYLLDDVDQYSVPTIAGLLIVLSALRYPRQGDAKTGAALLSGAAADQNSDDAHNRADPSV